MEIQEKSQVKGQKSTGNKGKAAIVLIVPLLIIGMTISILLMCQYQSIFAELKDSPQNQDQPVQAGIYNEDRSTEESSSLSLDPGMQETGSIEQSQTEGESITDLYAGWTYVELQQCHISFYYPSNWHFEKFGEELRCAWLALSPDTSVGKVTDYPFFMMMMQDTLSGYESPEELYAAIQENNSTQTVTVTTRIIDGQEMTYVIRTIPELTKKNIQSTYYQYQGAYYSINWDGLEIEAYEGEIDKLLESIKIID